MTSEVPYTSNTLIFEGILLKKGQINTSWKERWFRLYNNRHLTYYASKKDSEPKGNIDLSEVQAINELSILSQSSPKSFNNNDIKSLSNNSSTSSLLQSIKKSDNLKQKKTNKEYSFEIITQKRTYVLSSKNEKDFTNWLLALEKIVFGNRLHQGWLIKRGHVRKTWKKRWFIIYDTQEMRYYDDDKQLNPRGLIKLHDVLLMCPGDTDQYTQSYTIQLMTPDRNWVLATENSKDRDLWFSKLENVMHNAKRLVTKYESYLWKKGQITNKLWKKRYFALSKGWLFYFEEQFHCNKFKSIAFFSETFFNQAFRLYVKGSIPLHQTTIQKVDIKKEPNINSNNNSIILENNENNNNNNQISNDTTNETKQYIFKIKTNTRTFYFACDTKNELDLWFKAFHSTQYSEQSYDDDSSSLDDDDDESDIIVKNLKEGSKKGLSDVDENEEFNDDKKENNIDDDDDDEDDDNILAAIDPNGDGKWVDLEWNEKLRNTQRGKIKSQNDK